MKKRIAAFFLAITVVFSAAAQTRKNDFPLVFQNGDLSIHFLELGNKYTGDCVYINYGNIDIIIDAGSRPSSAAAIKAYMDNYIRDNKLEYVIATHAHEDHIAGFYGCQNHPFIDGNKRAALASSLVFLDINGYEFNCKDEMVYNKIMNIAKGETKKEELIKFYEKYSKKSLAIRRQNTKDNP